MSLFDFLQPKSGDKNEDVGVSDQLMTLTDVIAPSAINISPRSINISGMSARVFYVVSYPRYLNEGWMEPILNIEKELDISIVIHPIF